MSSKSQTDEAFVAFVRETQAGLRRIAYAMCGDWQHAEDIVQTALAKMYLRWPKLTDGEGRWSYARRAVVNAAIDEHRRRRGRFEESIVADLPERPVEGPAAVDDLLLAALTGLPTMQRAVVVLRYLEDVEVEQVARMLGITAGTVKSHAHRGLSSLRAVLDSAYPTNISSATSMKDGATCTTQR